jgi:hypothetical protein
MLRIHPELEGDAGNGERRLSRRTPHACAGGAFLDAGGRGGLEGVHFPFTNVGSTTKWPPSPQRLATAARSAASGRSPEWPSWDRSSRAVPMSSCPVKQDHHPVERALVNQLHIFS